MSLLNQTGSVILMNIRSIPQRLWMSLATVVSIALVVAVLLGFLALAVVFALQDLDAPQAGRQHEEARRDPPRHEAEGSVALVDLVEDEHG